MATHILLVDLDQDFRSNIRQSLGQLGFTVTDVENAEQASEQTKRIKFDLAIIDLMLENADSGFTLSYHFKKDFPKMPIVLLSKAQSEMNIDFSMESASERAWIKADALLNKPLRFEQLVYEIQRLLGILPKTHSHH